MNSTKLDIYIEKRIVYLEKEIKKLRNIIETDKRNPVSFSGIARTNLNEKELDKAIKQVRKS